MIECKTSVRKFAVASFIFLILIAIIVFFVENNSANYAVKWIKYYHNNYFANSVNYSICPNGNFKTIKSCESCKNFDNMNFSIIDKPVCTNNQYYELLYCNNTNANLFIKCMNPAFIEAKKFWLYEFCLVISAIIFFALFKLREKQLEIISNRKIDAMLMSPIDEH